MQLLLIFRNQSSHINAETAFNTKIQKASRKACTSLINVFLNKIKIKKQKKQIFCPTFFC